ncbi:MAG: early protein GP4 [Erysipelotrichaceae bacterium]
MSETQLTRSGIAYNLEVSPHRAVITYGKEEVTYVFSSSLYMNKFMERIEENRSKVIESLKTRWGLTVILDELSDIKLYSSIEKRGFLIETDKERFTCLSSIILNGESLMNKN